MLYHIVIAGLHDTDTSTKFADVMEHIEVYLKDAGITYSEVYLERQENV